MTEYCTQVDKLMIPTRIAGRSPIHGLRRLLFLFPTLLLALTPSDAMADTLTDSPTWLPRLGDIVDQVERASEQLTAERVSLLDEAADKIAKVAIDTRSIGLNFICTHNSRRSHLAQLWAAVAAERYGLPQVQTYSGGTEATACNERIVRSLRRAGFSVVAQEPRDSNPRYWVQFAERSAPVELYSKVYDGGENPKDNFFAMMCCSDADDKCPVVTGAVGRVALHYRDPKASDGTDQEAATYDERRDEIGAEMWYLMRAVAERLSAST